MATKAGDVPASGLHLPKFITEHLALWFLGVIGALALAGAMGYLDTRHLQRYEHEQEQHVGQVQRIEDKIQTSVTEIERLTLYNEFGSEANKPARDQLILREQNKLQQYSRELDQLNLNAPKAPE